MKKNKQLMHQKRIIKSKERRQKGKERRKSEEFQKTVKLLKFLTGKFDLFNAVILNYLNSEYATGIWNPIFPEAHTTAEYQAPTMDLAINKILLGIKPEDVTLKHRIMVQWLNLPISLKKKMYGQVSAILFGEDGLPKAHDPQVWEFAEKMRFLVEMSLGVVQRPENPVSDGSLPEILTSEVQPAESPAQQEVAIQQ